MKLVVLSVLAAAALASAGCGGGRGDGNSEVALSGYSGSGDSAQLAAAQVQSGGVSGGPGITVVGSGTADAVPDVADWSFGVRSRAQTAEEALAANSVAMRKVLNALRSAGISKDDLRTDQVSIYPETSSDGGSITGYSASNTVTATIRDLGKAGAIVDDAVAAGANETYGPNLRLSDATEQYKQAVDEAFDDARARAEAIAAKAGVTLGEPVAIVEGGGYVPGPVMYDRALASGAEMAPIEPGNQQVTASLSVTFAIG